MKPVSNELAASIEDVQQLMTLTGNLSVAYLAMKFKELRDDVDARLLAMEKQMDERHGTPIASLKGRMDAMEASQERARVAYAEVKHVQERLQNPEQVVRNADELPPTDEPDFGEG